MPRLTLDHEHLGPGPVPVPVPVLVRIGLVEDEYAYLPDSGRLRRLPDLNRGEVSSRSRLAPGGGAVLFERATVVPPPPSEPDQRTTAVHRLDLRNGQITRLNYTPPPGWADVVRFDQSPDGRDVALLQVLDERLRREDGAEALVPRLQLWLTPTGGGEPEQVLSRPGMFAEHADDYPLQWSRDGCSLALGVLSWDVEHGWVERPDVLLVDPRGVEETVLLPDLWLVGSASWSPDGSRLLGYDGNLKQVVECDLATGRRRPVAAVPSPRPLPERQGLPRVLGYADDEHLLAVTQRGMSMTLHRTDLDARPLTALARWTGHDANMYPTLALMPPGYWSTPRAAAGAPRGER